MPDTFPTTHRRIGYCTNVHAGGDLETTQSNLQQHAIEVKRRFSPHRPMGIGLWLSAQTARALLAADGFEPFADWLKAEGLLPFTLNGFPYGDFHQKVVKHRVYEPAWMEEDRERYTLDLVTILDRLLPPGEEGSISTLPIGWGDPALSSSDLDRAAERLRRVASRLAKLENDSGRLIHLCIEPEPGCAIQRGSDVVRFFEQHLLKAGNESEIRRYLRVCHDVCHSAVMFEGQREVLKRYKQAEIRVGKVQVSSAICLDLDTIAMSDRPKALEQLSQFAEDRYLHQTMIRQSNSEPPTFYEDLPLALQAANRSGLLSGRWHVHFHVPIHVDRFDWIGTSQQDILECLEATSEDSELIHYEVETYAWNVLPKHLRPSSLAVGIADEMRWLENVCEPNLEEKSL